MHPTPPADRFDEAFEAFAAEIAAPELLPARVARACANALPVDGAGLSLHAGALRVPIGASSEVAAYAERMQFTFGDGPCLRAHDTGQAIDFAPADIERNWPDLYAALMADSPYRGVLSLPLPEPLGPTVVLDLWVHQPSVLPGLDRRDVDAVLHRATGELARSLRDGPRVTESGSTWLENEDALRRSSTWQAVGLLAMALILDTPDALEVLRAAAVTSGRSVDDVGRDLLTGAIEPLDLAAAPVPDE